MVVPKGGEGAYLHGTNNSEFPGYGQRVEAGDLSFGREKEFMTKVRGRPVAFTEELETYKKRLPYRVFQQSATTKSCVRLQFSLSVLQNPPKPPKSMICNPNYI